MVDAPEKIWAYETPDGDTGWLCDPTHGQATGSTEYLRIDLVADKADAWDAIAEKNAKIADLQRQLDEMRAERDYHIRDAAAHFAESCKLADRALTVEADRDRLAAELERKVAVAKEALEIIAGKRQCLDNLMGNADVAEAALASLEDRA